MEMALTGKIMARASGRVMSYVFTNLIPDFPERAKPGDIVVTGKRFGQGNPHIYGPPGMAGLGVGLIAESVPYFTCRMIVSERLIMLLFSMA